MPTVTAGSNGSGLLGEPIAGSCAEARLVSRHRPVTTDVLHNAARANRFVDFIRIVTSVAGQLSSRLGFIQLGDRSQETRAVSLQFHWTYSANILQCAERPWSPHRQLRESTIREYNIRRHLFLAGDPAADRLERRQSTLLRRTKGDVIVGNLRSRTMPRRFLRATLAWLFLRLARNGSDPKT
ncbi:MAG TPA: hypothetical protein VHT23_12195, partial [Gemmatimonadaceae bacterium]|nr:hypothetical protein [Gemmatimonadaceae bacterium]